MKLSVARGQLLAAAGRLAGLCLVLGVMAAAQIVGGGGGSGNATALQGKPVAATAPANGNCLVYTTNWGPGSCAGTASANWSSLVSGTNTTGAFLIGTGASLAASGTGTITATSTPASGLTGSLTSAQVGAAGTLTNATSGNAATATALAATPAQCGAGQAPTGILANGNATGCAAFGTGNGSVTSVGLSLPGIFSVSGSPVTGSGTLAGALATQTANAVFAGPSSGAAAAPTFRALVSADIPANAANTTGTASNVTGTVATANGGTGATSLANAGIPVQTGTITSGDCVKWASGTSITDAGAACGSGGGMSNPMTAAGDMIVGGTSGAPARLAAGTSGYVLTSTGTSTAPSWQAASGGGGTVYEYAPWSFSGGSTGGTPAATNTVMVFSFSPTVQSKTAQISFYVSTADPSATDYYDIGVVGCTAPGGTGTLIADIGSGSQGVAFTAAGGKSIAWRQGAVTIPVCPSGLYAYLVFTGSAATAAYRTIDASSVFMAAVGGSSSTTSSNGQLPSSISIPSADWTYNPNTAFIPVADFHN